MDQCIVDVRIDGIGDEVEVGGQIDIADDWSIDVQEGGWNCVMVGSMDPPASVQQEDVVGRVDYIGAVYDSN